MLARRAKKNRIVQFRNLSSSEVRFMRIYICMQIRARLKTMDHDESADAWACAVDANLRVFWFQWKIQIAAFTSDRVHARLITGNSHSYIEHTHTHSTVFGYAQFKWQKKKMNLRDGVDELTLNLLPRYVFQLRRCRPIIISIHFTFLFILLFNICDLWPTIDCAELYLSNIRSLAAMAATAATTSYLIRIILGDWNSSVQR